MPEENTTDEQALEARVEPTINEVIQALQSQIADLTLRLTVSQLTLAKALDTRDQERPTQQELPL